MVCDYFLHFLCDCYDCACSVGDGRCAVMKKKGFVLLMMVFLLLSVLPASAAEQRVFDNAARRIPKAYQQGNTAHNFI